MCPTKRSFKIICDQIQIKFFYWKQNENKERKNSNENKHLKKISNSPLKLYNTTNKTKKEHYTSVSSILQTTKKIDSSTKKIKRTKHNKNEKKKHEIVFQIVFWEGTNSSQLYWSFNNHRFMLYLFKRSPTCLKPLWNSLSSNFPENWRIFCFGDTLEHRDNLFDTTTIENYCNSHKATDFYVRK